MPLRIITVGKKHEDWVLSGIERYHKRLQAPFLVEWVLLPHSSLEGARAREEESDRIVKRLNDNDYVILLDERGKNIDSPALSRVLLEPLEQSRTVSLVVGGAYGVDDTVRRRANFVWSLSNLVFPHQLVRLIVVEQLYRAQEISRGGPYHHT